MKQVIEYDFENIIYEYYSNLNAELKELEKIEEEYFINK